MSETRKFDHDIEPPKWYWSSKLFQQFKNIYLELFYVPCTSVSTWEQECQN